MPQRIALPEDEIVLLYRIGGLTEREIGARYSVTRMPIKRILKAHGVAMRPSCRRPIYSHNTHFFDRIETEAQAYWLGFIGADGVLSRRGVKGSGLTLHLAIKDIDHIYRFRDAIGATNPVAITAGGKEARMSLWGVEIPDALARYGVTERKTYTHPWPSLSDDLLRHFLRGYFDGDGWVSPLALGVIGSVPFITAWRAYIKTTCDGNGSTRHPKGNPDIAIAQYGGRRQVKRIHDYLYDGATIMLPRKAHRI